MTRWLRIAASALLVAAIFFFALPKIADFSKVWSELSAMTWLELATLASIALWNIVTYWFVMMASLPGSNVWQTMKVNQASTAVANTLPGGGAIAIGVTYGMYSGYGFDHGRIGLSVLITGLWNNFVKLGMPVVALGLLALQGDASGSLITAAAIGTAALIGFIGVFGAILSSERLARKVGVGLDRVVATARRFLRRQHEVKLPDATVRFRTDATDLVKRRGIYLSAATLVSHLSLFLVLLFALRHVGVSENQVGWIEALAAFAFVRLLSALPLTPGGLGVVELGLTAGLVAAGGPRAATVAAVLVFRALTYLLPIPFGLAAYVKWRRGSEARRERLAAAAAPPAPVAPGGP